MSVNRVDTVTGLSVAVYKRCAEEYECNIDNVGCHESTIPGVLVSNLTTLLIIIQQSLSMTINGFYDQEPKLTVTTTF